MLEPFTQSTSPTPTSLNDALAGATWHMTCSNLVTGMFKSCLFIFASFLYDSFWNITIRMLLLFILRLLSRIRYLTCYLLVLSRCKSLQGGLCVEPNPSMHKYFEVHRRSNIILWECCGFWQLKWCFTWFLLLSLFIPSFPKGHYCFIIIFFWRPSCELVKNCPLAAQKSATGTQIPNFTAPVVPRCMESPSAGRGPLGIGISLEVWRFVVYYCKLWGFFSQALYEHMLFFFRTGNYISHGPMTVVNHQVLITNMNPNQTGWFESWFFVDSV